MMDIIEAYCAAVPPEPFGAEEARRFISYVRARDLPVPHLTEILNFEAALNAVAGTSEERTVTFDCDPAALFSALLERQNPGRLACERTPVDVSAKGIKIGV